VVFGVSLKKRYAFGTWMTAGIALASVVLMMILFDGVNPTRVYYGTDTRLFGLMTGAGLAFLSYWAAQGGRAAKVLALFSDGRPATVMGWSALIALLGVAVFLTPQNPVVYYGGLFGVSLLTGITLLVGIYRKGSLQQFLSIPLVVWIGLRSYGIYLWHWPLLVLTRLVLPHDSPVWLIASIVTVLTFSVAAASYRYIEIPIRKQGFGHYMRSLFRPNLQAAQRVSPKAWIMTGVTIVVIGLGASALITAPAQTVAQKQIAAGQAAIEKAKQQAPQAHQIAPPMPQSASSIVLNGADMVIIGDSVTLSAAPSLQARFPGIEIDAQISRAFRTGGMDDIATRLAQGTMRQVVVIAMATNGYFGTGNLDKVIQSLEGHTVIFVTAFAPDEWVAGNNLAVRQAAAQYPNVFVASWDTLIEPHVNDLSDDQVHPIDSEGRDLYAQAIADSVNQKH
jgi:hypothetical protein